MHKDLEEVEIKQLVVINGMPGLWKIRQFIKNGEFINVINIANSIIKTLPSKKASPIKNYIIYSNSEAGQIPLDDVINTIMKLAETEDIPSSNGFKKLDAKIKKGFMTKIVPEYSDEFKDYHMEKILKWYEELQKYFNELNKDIKDL